MSDPIRRALLSVWDKKGLARFARGLSDLGVTLLATGGTAELLRREGLYPSETRDLTGFASVLGGRVKTLHPRVHAGILARRDHPEDMDEIRRQEIGLIDMVVVNFYPFPDPDGAADLDFSAACELVDIGGPAMLRAAAKNCRHVVPVSRPDQYESILREMQERGGEVSGESRLALARDAFALASDYDRGIASYLAVLASERGPGKEPLPDTYWLWGTRTRELAYGENPHQRAAFFQRAGCPPAGLAVLETLGGKPLSYNNLLDLDGLVRLLGEFSRPAAAIVKHNTPCGVAVGESAASALRQALDCDRESAFGGVLGVNCALTPEAVREIGDLFLEVLAFPTAGPDALAALAGRKRLRLVRLAFGDGRSADPMEVRSVSGGFLVQDRDTTAWSREALRVVTKRSPTAEEWPALEFAWRVARHVKSNAIVLARGERTVGIGAGQMSRVDAVRLACRKAAQAGHETQGTVLASDGFFPFADSIQDAARAGVTAFIEPGGSIRDAEVIQAADEAGQTLVFTDRRHFRH